MYTLPPPEGSNKHIKYIYNYNYHNIITTTITFTTHYYYYYYYLRQWIRRARAGCAAASWQRGGEPSVQPTWAQFWQPQPAVH